MNILIQHIIQQLEDIQEAKLWIGSNFKSQLNKVSEQDFFKRPMEDLHSVAEILSHLTLWREETVLKIKTGKGSKTDECEENWLPNNQLQLKGAETIKSNYDNSLIETIRLLQNKDDSFLQQEYYDTDFKGNYTYQWLLNGMIQHDVYHLGQIGIIIKFLKAC